MSNKVSLRNFPNAQSRREFLAKELSIKLDKVANFNFTEDQAVGRNIENLIGSTQIPLGVAGPIRICFHSVILNPKGEGSSPIMEDSSLIVQNDKEKKDYYVPLATTEGALVASVSRGCKAITDSGGTTVFVEDVGITRGPVFKTTGIMEGQQTKKWIDEHFTDLAKVAEATSHHLKLKKIGCRIVGKNLFARFYYGSQDAMGMNMATIATEEAVKFIEEKTKVKCVSVAGNFDIDKKPAWLNFISGRGKRIWAEITLSKKVLKEVLKTTPENLAEVVYRKCLLGSTMSGSLGFNAHFANILSAIFAATGQDLAHVVEGSLGITTAEVLNNGDLYFSIYLPSLIVGTIGGGTHLPTQQEALRIMQAESVLEYARAIGGAVLAGELSLLASLSEGSLVKAHKRLGRKKS